MHQARKAELARRKAERRATKETEGAGIPEDKKSIAEDEGQVKRVEDEELGAEQDDDDQGNTAEAEEQVDEDEKHDKKSEVEDEVIQIVDDEEDSKLGDGEEKAGKAEESWPMKNHANRTKKLLT